MTSTWACAQRIARWQRLARICVGGSTASTVLRSARFKAHTAAAAPPLLLPSLDARASFPARLDDGRSSPVVVILGWLHGSDKHLAKYSAFYNESGCIAIRVPVTSMPVLFLTSVERGQQVLDVLAKEPFAKREIVFHVMSNGGCTVFAQILRLLTVERSRGACDVAARGVIYDSAPSRPRLSAGIRAFTAHIADPVDRMLRKFVVGLRIMCTSLPRSFGALTGRYPYLYDELRLSASRLPELFLYSKVDRITHYQDVANFIAYRRELGVSTAEVCWENSEHVSHLLAHREEYVRQCLSFVDRCCNLSKAV